ncbi:MAG: ATP-binding protein, partial [Deltaproteobacteria bacterium]|nr:ATP-binding protein [Deltaproteobacteria bacterium]
MPAKRPVRPKADARRSHAVRTGKLRAADPFELIRWLARSQPDPRKALAELVQNSLDAAARSIRISRLRKAGIAELRILDDGEGVIPELGREEALHHLATHVGHSRKADLTPAQRRELMMQGKYGIGLLGFWAIGNVLEIRSKVAGQDPMLLRLHEDSPEFEIEHLRGRLPLEGECWTEVVVRRLHPQAFSSLGARRMAEFLGSELRGQLLAHAAQVLVYDGIARGRATKVIEVQPRRFHGERIDLPASVAVPGYGALQIELYLLPVGDEAGKVAVAQAGTVVYDDIADLTLADFARAPWSEPRLGGLLEFADFQVPPGNRRAVVPDAAAAAFVAAVRGIEVLVAECIAAAEAAVGAELEANLFKQLERAFREVPRRAPEYDFFEVLDRRRAGFAPGITSETDAANGEASEAIPADRAAGEVPPG